MSSQHRSKITAAFAISLTLALLAGASGCSAWTDSATSADTVTTDGYESAVAPDSAQERSALSVGEDVAMDSAAGADAATVPQADRLIIKTAGIRLDVEDVEVSVDKIRQQAEDIGGVVSDVQVSTSVDIPVYRYDAEGTLSDNAALSGWVTVRVPAESYNSFLDSMKELGDVVRQAENESDVTQQHIDLAAQLANLKAQEARLREFYEQAADVTDLLAIEQELTRVRSQIDSLEAQIAYLERQAAMSTVTIELVGPQPIVSPQGENWGFVEAITTGIRAAANVAKFAITFVLATSPIWIFGLVAILVVQVILRRRRTTAKEDSSE